MKRFLFGERRNTGIHLCLALVLPLQFFQVIEATADTAGSGNCVQIVGSMTGVTVVETDTDCIVTFNVTAQDTAVSNSWTAPAGVTSTRILVVGGGASGDRGWCGYFYGHGGGGGQVRDLTAPITAGNTYSIQVGGGGSVGYTSGCPNTSGDNGDNSYFGEVTAYGGKGAQFNVANGGDSGALQFKGESGPISGLGGGAGAGAGGPGGTVLLKGGTGVDSNISGSTLMYGSGGAGQNSSGAGTAFSGGASATTLAAENRGGGGMDPGGVANKQNGAAGVVIIRYKFVTTCSPIESRNDSSTVLTFTNLGTCNWQAPTSISSINVLLVGGGGGGGGWVAGGGGGGGVVQQLTNITSGNSYPISVASGGRGTHVMGGTGISAGTNGGDTTAFGFTAFGGGLGATWTEYSTGSRATGGGGGRSSGTGSLASPDALISPAQGFSGGSATGNSSFGFPAGGGGGAGSAGGDASNGNSGSGGAGRSSTISGASTFYGGGGGGGCHGEGTSPCANGSGTNGGGNGNGFTSSLPSTGFSILGGSGAVNTGGGGGGAGIPYSRAYNHAIGGSGGSGIVIVSFIRYTSTDDYALQFNGTNQYAWAPDNSTFDVSGDLTVQVWVNPASATADSIIVRKELSYQIYQSNGFWYFSVSPTGSSWSAFNTGVPVRANEWQHLAITRAANSDSATFYYNGVLAKTGTGLGTAPNRDSSDPFILGGWFSGGTYQSNWKYAGKMDHVQIYSAVRTEAQIASDMHSYVSPTTSNLRLSYDFNEGTEARLFNRTSTATLATDLTLMNTPTWTDVKTVDTSSSAAHTIVSFPRSYITSDGGWRVPSGVDTATVLVVAGGGGGGSRVGGGGGAGGLVLRNQFLKSNGIETITVGVGGVGVANYAGKDGSDSIFGTSITAIGGGGGGASNEYGERAGRPGGSGGGTGDASGNGASTQIRDGSIDGKGFAGAVGQGGGSWSAGGGGGSVRAGYSGVDATKPGFGGDGTPLDISGTTVCYAAGGGGGIYGASYSVRNNAGGCASASSTAGSGVAGGFTGLSATPSTGSGGGGAGYVNSASGNDLPGGSGGSGIIVIRWITIKTPTFTGPISDTLTAGLVETFTVSGSPISSLTRSYRWQFSTETGTATSWVNISTGTGFTSANYTTPILETTTSGIRYQYRVIVTDSDTAGLSISESASVYLVINPRITVTGSSVTLTQKYGETQTVTYSIANGTGTRTTTASPNNRTGITWSSVSGSSATLAIASTLGFGTYYETLTVTDSVTATTTQMITIAVSKADTITVMATRSTTTYNGAAITPAYVISGLMNGETATATSNFLGINGTSYGTTTTPPTNAGSYRFNPSDIVLSVGASLNNYQGVTYESATVTINKAFQAKLSIGQYDAFPGISSYPINVYGGTGLGEVTRTLVDTGTANCALSGALILTASQVGTCTVRAVKDGGVNYFAETTTATIYWMTFINRYTPSAPTTPTDLGLSGSTGFEKSTYETFTVVSFANGSGTAITSVARNSIMRIIGTGFNSSDETTEVIIGFFSIPWSSLTFNTSNPLENYVELTLPNSADLDLGANEVAMKSRKGWAYASGLLTIT